MGIDIRTDRNDVVPYPQFRYGFGIRSSIGGNESFANPSTKFQQAADDPPTPPIEIILADDAGATIVATEAYRHVIVAMSEVHSHQY